LNVTALDHVSLDIAAGDFVALMGPSGSGKSTLLYIMAGIDRPTRGQCVVSFRRQLAWRSSTHPPSRETSPTVKWD